MVMLQEIRYAATWYQIYFGRRPLPAPPPGPEDWVERSNFNFSEHGHVAYQI